MANLINLTEDNWRAIPGFPNYQISATGLVKALSILKARGRFYQKRDDLIIKSYQDKRGYKSVTLINDLGLRQYIGVHRLVAMAFIPNPHNKPTVNHKNGVKYDNRIENLEWATHKEQINHADNLGLRNVKGSGTPKSKLNESIVLEIRNGRMSYQYYAKLYGVNKSCISKIKTYRTWKHI